MIRGLVAVTVAALPLMAACNRFGASTQDGCSKDVDCKGDRVCQNGQCVAPAGAPAASSTPTAANDGTDPKNPVLAPDDVKFLDARHGWGWSDRCWKEEHAGKNGWAWAACQQGLELLDLDPKAKPALLYNEGLALEGSGDRVGAQGLSEASLGLRPANDPGRAEVAAALARVGGTPPAVHYSTTYACGGTRCTVGQTCCEDRFCVNGTPPVGEKCALPDERACDPKTNEPCGAQHCRAARWNPTVWVLSCAP